MASSITFPIFSDATTSFKQTGDDVTPDVWSLVAVLVKQAKEGKRPDGTPQPPNSQYTLKLKVKRGEGATSGVASGALSTASNWTVSRQNVTVWEVAPPKNRDRIITKLRSENYEFVGIPETWRKAFLKRVSESFIKNQHSKTQSVKDA